MKIFEVPLWSTQLERDALKKKDPLICREGSWDHQSTKGFYFLNLTGYQQCWIFNIAFKSQNLSTIFKVHQASHEAHFALDTDPTSIACIFEVNNR